MSSLNVLADACADQCHLPLVFTTTVERADVEKLCEYLNAESFEENVKTFNTPAMFRARYIFPFLEKLEIATGGIGNNSATHETPTSITMETFHGAITVDKRTRVARITISPHSL